MSEYANYDDYHDPDEEDSYDAIYGKKNSKRKIIKKILLYTLRITTLLVFAVLFWRIFSGDSPDSMKKFLWTESSIEQYNKSPEDFKVYHYKHKDNLSAEGKFSASEVYFVPSIGQLQVTVRFNNSTLDKVVEEYKLEEKPDKDAFVFVLTDHLGNAYTEYSYISDEKNVYNYRRLVFEGIDMSKITVDEPSPNATPEERKKIEKERENVYLFLNVYYKDRVVLSKPFSSLPVYDYVHYHAPYSIKEYTKKELEPTKGLTGRQEYTVMEEPEETEATE
ncbi:MAG: hypothetical protein IJN17_03740 [Clostridia bacterium]|nr:hypothetical protein [Clostridia bacterium]